MYLPTSWRVESTQVKLNQIEYVRKKKNNTYQKQIVLLVTFSFRRKKKYTKNTTKYKTKSAYFLEFMPFLWIGNKHAASYFFSRWYSVWKIDKVIKYIDCTDGSRWWDRDGEREEKINICVKLLKLVSSCHFYFSHVPYNEFECYLFSEFVISNTQSLHILHTYTHTYIYMKYM